jgi:phasin
MTTETNSATQDPMSNGIKQAFAPLTDAFKNLQNMDVPAGARDFVKKAAGTAQERSTEFHARSEKVTEAIETALTGTVTEVAKLSRNFGQAAYEDAQALFAGIEKLASATSLNEAVQIQSDMVRARGELFMTRAKASAEYLGKLVSDSAKATQDNLAKAYGKTA